MSILIKLTTYISTKQITQELLFFGEDFLRPNPIKVINFVRSNDFDSNIEIYITHFFISLGFDEEKIKLIFLKWKTNNYTKEQIIAEIKELI